MPTTRRPLLLAGLLLAIAAAPVRAHAAQEAPAARAAAFDRLFEALDSERLIPATPEESKAYLARLRALVPPGDTGRELRYKALACSEPPEDAGESLDYARRALAEARAAGDHGAQARLLYCQAGFTEMVDDPRAALDLYTEGIAIARRAGERELEADGLSARGNVHSYFGEYAAALADFVAAQGIYDATGRKASADANLQNIAVAYRRMGEFDRARQYLERSRELARQQQDWYGLLIAWLQLGYLDEELHRPDQALAAYAEALKVARQRLGPGDSGPAWLGTASALIAKGDHHGALRALEHARADLAAINDRSSEGMLDLVEGQAREGLGEHRAALAAFDRAERTLQRERNERYLALLYPERARVREHLGQAAAALSDYRRYVALREKLLAARNDQRTLMMRQQFEATRRELENQRLRTEKLLRDQQVRALLDARRWQYRALALGSVLLVLLAAFAIRQVARLRRLRVLALTDELTGVANRRRIELIASEALARARADGRPLSLVTFDIDHFKRVNDGFGHLAGDEVIARVADACQQALRQADQLGRTGGEEFLVVLPDTDLTAAAQVAGRLGEAVEALRWPAIAPELRVTISLGVTELRPDDDALGDILRRADTALYQAKAGGRNRLRTA